MATTTDGDSIQKDEVHEAAMNGVEAISEEPSGSPADAQEIKKDLAKQPPLASASPETDSDDTRNKLAKAREELSKALAESARAKDDMEKIKLDLEEARTIQKSPMVKEEKLSADAEVKLAQENTDNSEITEATVSSSKETMVKSETTTAPNTAATAEQNSVLVQDTRESAEPAPAKPTPVESTAVESTPVESTPAESTPLESTPVESTPVESTPVESTPVESTPVESTEPTLESESQEIMKENGSSQLDDTKEEGEITEDNDGEQDQQGEEEHSEDEGAVEGEEDEQGKEAVVKLDDDEDRRNPQYIPKRGGFYEHDDRTREEEAAGVVVTEVEPEEEKPKKGSRSEVVDRWGHDMFDATEQGPKSNNELVDSYGYDIRVEEGAPRARRRRRYGRGPNKYDRTWEDEEAYSRPRGRGGATSRGDFSGAPRGGRDRPRTHDGAPPRAEDFPALNNQVTNQPSEMEVKSPSNWRESNRQDSAAANAISFRRGGGGRTFEERNKSKMIKGRGEQLESNHSTEMDQDVEVESPQREHWKNGGHRGGSSMARGSHRGSGNPAARGAPAFRGRRRDNMNWDNKDHPEDYRSGPITNRGGHSGAPAGVHSDATGYSNEAKGRGRGKFGRPDKNDPATIGLQQLHIDDRPQQQESNVSRSKRYSSQRSRMTTPPPAGGVVMPPYVASASTAYYSSYNDSPPPNFVPPSNYTDASAPLLPLVGNQGAPPFIAPPIGYPTAAFQGYPAANAPPVQVAVPISSPTQDLYGGGGIMYYDPGTQPVRHGGQPLRRLKAAIPIVAPDNDVDNYILSGRRANPNN